MQPQRKPYLVPLFAFAVALPAPAFALDGAELYVKKTCFTCHGRDANSPILPIYPKLAGQNPDYSYNQMLDIKRGLRVNGQATAMKGIMHLVSDDEMRAIADWLGTLK